MTDNFPPDPEGAGDDQKSYPFSYGTGRMPLFMKLLWIGFLALSTWFIVTYLLTSLGQELGA